MDAMRTHQSEGPSEMIPSFLLKTYEILENPKYSDIITWTKSGEGFIVKKVKDFTEQVLPIHFRHSNYTSFVRQLNMYDFHKTRQENQENAFKNLMFRKGCKHLLKDIQRKDYKKNKENNKEQKPVEHKKHDPSFDSQCYSKLLYSTLSLEPKIIQLANLKQIPSNEPDIIQLLDLLFEIKALNHTTFERYNEYYDDIKQARNSETQSTKMKEEMENIKKQETKDSKGTYHTLFSTEHLY